jgi:hypothetical protein
MEEIGPVDWDRDGGDDDRGCDDRRRSRVAKLQARAIAMRR